MADQVQVGDKVSWTWGSAQPSGTASEVKAGEVTVTSHRGNDISKTGDENNPAVHISRSGNDVVKKASELTVDKPATASSATTEEKQDGKNENKIENKVEAKMEDKKEDKTVENGEMGNGEPQTGDKRKADVATEGHKVTNGNGVTEKDKQEEKIDEADTKKQKIETNGNNQGAKRGPGRPKGGAKKDKKEKVPVVGKAERKTRSQGNA